MRNVDVRICKKITTGVCETVLTIVSHEELELYDRKDEYLTKALNKMKDVNATRTTRCKLVKNEGL